jgi:hypothetical protein
MTVNEDVFIIGLRMFGFRMSIHVQDKSWTQDEIRKLMAHK